MWSFGAVLFHILCGSPPYMGRGDDRGAQMLRNIMTTDADYNQLRKVKVSEEGIDFISKLLNRDPKARPREAECLKHPWIADVPDEFEYMEVDEAQEEEINADLKAIAEVSEPESSEYERLDASGIDLNDVTNDPFAEESEAEAPNSSEPVNIKRPRVTEEQEASHISASVPDQIPYPSLPNISSYNFGSSVHLESTPKGPRLFGEITNMEGLESSVALGDNLATPMNGPQFQREFESMSRSGYPSSNGKSSSYGHSLHTTTPSNYLLSEMESRFGGSASSLMGAESLVGNLNMGSFGDGATSTSSDNPAVATEKRSETTSNDVHDSQDRNNGADVEDDSDDEADHAGRRSRIQPIFSPSQPKSTPQNNKNRSSRSPQKQPVQKNPSTRSPRLSDASWDELACTIDERTGEEIRQSMRLGVNLSSGSNIIAHHSQTVTKLAETSQRLSKFTKPPSILGRLTPVAGSITDQIIKLDSRMTSWGRGTSNSIRYPNLMDARIPTYALELTFWAPAIESRIDAGEDWLQMSDVVTIVSTKTSKHIWVNDVELRSETPDGDSYLFGRIYTGDIITIYRNRNREEFLQYRCEFFHGNSAQPRPADEEGFFIEKTKKFRSNSPSKIVPSVTVSTVTGAYTENDFQSHPN